MPIEADLPIRPPSRFSMQTTDINVQPDLSLDKDNQSLKPVDGSLLGGEATQTGGVGIEVDGITAPEALVTIDVIPPETPIVETLPEEPAQTNVTSPPTPVAGSAPPPAMKRFSSANISKKFMQKASSVSGNQGTHSTTGNSQSIKSATTQLANGRPNPPNGVAHPSRLVTAKLTNAVPSSASSPGWSASRPGSASSTANPSPAQTPGAAQMARRDPNSIQNGAASNDRGRIVVGKPWGDLKKPQSGGAATSSDFPTAAEVANTRAQTRLIKPALGLSVAEPVPAKVVSADSSADAFRGVHLDPNVHQWYEDDNDDNDFLGDVVQFGDGTQYSVPPTAASEFPPDLAPPDRAPLATSSVNDNDARISTKTTPKEDRFHDDFDRSWPRGPPSRKEPSLVGNSPKPPAREVTSPAPSHASTLHSERDRDRALFNEKSNRLEPYSSSDRGSYFQNRDGESTRSSGFRSARDQTRFPIHDRDREIQHNVGPRTPNFGGRGSGRPPWAERAPSGQFRPSGQMGPPGMQPPNSGSAWNRGEIRRSSISSRDEGYAHNLTGNPRPTASSGGWNRPPSDWSARSSNVPIEQAQRVTSQKNDPLQTSPIRDRRPSISSAFSPRQGISGGILPSESDAVSASQTMEAPLVPPLGLEEVTKITMHSAAERAKIRRQEEEASREQQRERARAKAAAIEASQLALEEETRRKEVAQKEAERHEREVAEKVVADRKRKEEEVMKKLQEEERAMRNRERQAAEAREQERERSKRPVVVPPEVKLTPVTRPKLQLLPRTIPVTPVVPLPDPMQRKPDLIADSAHNSGSKAPPENASQEIIPGAPAEAVSYLDNHSGGDIQTVDFSEMASLMGVVEELQVDISERPAEEGRKRPIASDFFDDSQPSLPVNHAATKTSEPNVKSLGAPSWRNNTPSTTPVSPTTLQTPQQQLGNPSTDRTPPTPQKALNVTVTSPTLSASSRVTTSPTAQRSAFKQAPLSSLADTISRFKGVLATMQTVPEAAEGFESVPHIKQGVRTLAPPNFATSRTLDTAIAALYAMDDEATISLAKRLYYVLASETQETQAKFKFRRKYPQLKIMSYEPPIANIAPRTLSRDDILLNGKNVYNVHFKLPNSGAGRPQGLGPDRAYQEPLASKRGGFGRGSGAEEADWRRRPSAEAASPLQSQQRAPPKLAETMENQTSKGHQTNGIAVVIDDLAPVHRNEELSSPSRKGKNKVDPRADVGFYRTSQLPATFPAAPVSFMVVSEIEGTSPTASPEIEASSQQTRTGQQSETTPSSQSESTLLTPPATQSATSWTMSPAAFPLRSARSDTDPDHIKAVWEHGPPDSSTHANSLKDITDEYPAAILLSVQEIKSDDGEPKLDGDTVPPASLTAPAHRKSLQDAHRAFQMVPTPQQPFTGYQGSPTVHAGESYPSPMPDPYSLQGFQSGMPYGARPFQTPPVPNMMWTSQSPYAPPLSLGPHGVGPTPLTGQPPPVPHHGWTQQQPPPSPYPLYNGSPATYSYMIPPQNLNPSAFKVAANAMNPNPSFNPPSIMHTGAARRYPPAHHGQHPPPSPHYGAQVQPGGSQVTSPNIYGSSLPSAGQGYGSLSPAGRGGSRTTFELPPPATPQLYPQIGNGFQPHRW